MPSHFGLMALAVIIIFILACAVVVVALNLATG
jgi:hypothetical protein